MDDGAAAEVEKVPLDVLRWSLCDIDLTDVDEIREVSERVRKSIEQEHAAAEDRPLAMRIRLQGATKIADELAAYPDRLEHEIKALGAGTAGDDLWIERVENATVGKLDPEAMLADDNAMGGLLKEILNITNDINDIDGLQDKIAQLRQKVPSEAFGDDSIVNLDDEQTVRRIIEEAKRMLIGRLLTVEGAR